MPAKKKDAEIIEVEAVEVEAIEVDDDDASDLPAGVFTVESVLERMKDWPARERRLVERYVETSNISRSGKEAGYGKHSAYRVLQYPHIRKAIEDLTVALAMKESEMVMRMGQMARGEMATKVTREGLKLTEEYDALSALRHIADTVYKRGPKRSVNILMEEW